MVLHRNCFSIFLLVSASFGIATVASPVVHAATLTVVNNDGPGEGFNDPTARAPVGGNTGTTLGAQRLIAFQRAAEIWGGLLSSPVTIRVGATFDPLPCNSTGAVLGQAGPKTAFRDFTGALVPNTWYPVALANALHGSDLDPGVDITAQFNSSFGTTCTFPKGWYYGLDGSAGSDIDFVSVLLHELGHGLGFLTFVNLATGAKLAGSDDTFMLNLEDHGASPADYPSMSDAQRLAASKDTGNLHWIGAHVRAAGGILTAGRVGDHVRMFAPNPQQQGSSVSHWDTVLTPNQLLEPIYTEPLHNPVLELALFQDIGWTPSPPGPDLFIASTSLAAGNGNGVVDVNECNNLSVTLQNRGTGAATGVSATLAFNAPGLTIAQAGSAYPNIGVGGTGANTTPFKISTAPGFACGSNLDLTLTATTADGDVFVLPFTLNSGSVGSATRFDNNTTLQIPDNGPPVESTITVSGIATAVRKVTVSLFIDHTFDADLDISLVGPDGTTVELTSDNGGSGNNYGVACSPDGSRTTFDDAAATPITAGAAPFTGTFRPEGTLAAFVGKSGSAVNGAWKLRITDTESSDTGTLHCWSLSISGATCADGGGVCQLPPTVQPKLVNISTRGQVGTGDNVMIGGLIVTGTTPKTVLLRGRGPSLSSAPFFVPGTLANPLLRLFSGATLVAQNDNWQDAPNCGFACGGPSQIIATGLDPCQPNPGQGTPPPNCALESALLITLPPGGYTAILSGAAGESGVGLVEGFEVDGNTTAANLHNISTRGVVGTGDQIMIGGFVVDGPSPKQVLVRGRGPSLGGAPFSIPGVLADPFLRIFSGATSIARNNNWQDAPDCNPGFTCGTAAQITATGLDPCVPNPGQGTPPPNCAVESAILITLPPGGYTALLSGAAGQTGVALVEVFEIPF